MNVAAVVVTHNRPALLAEVLDALRKQTTPLGGIIVIDNASEQPTQALLAAADDLDVVRLERNVGGAGGFAAGVTRGVEAGYDWIWLLDDDAVPRTNALERLLAQAPAVAQAQRIGALCTAVIEFGEIALMHRRHFEPATLAEPALPKESYGNAATEIDTGSFVGFLLNSQAAREVGPPNAGFFLAYDDTEYSLRLRESHWSIWLVPSAVVDHKRLPTGRLRDGPYGMKHYYNLRNQLAVFRRYGAAPRWRLLVPIMKHAALAARDRRLASLRLWWRACRDSQRVVL